MGGPNLVDLVAYAQQRSATDTSRVFARATVVKSINLDQLAERLRL
jgi:hypothetical protein